MKRLFRLAIAGLLALAAVAATADPAGPQVRGSGSYPYQYSAGGFVELGFKVDARIANDGAARGTVWAERLVFQDGGWTITGDSYSVEYLAVALWDFVGGYHAVVNARSESDGALYQFRFVESATTRHAGAVWFPFTGTGWFTGLSKGHITAIP